MPIVFNCPNGHRLNCPPEQAGKPGKCPHCGAVFRVPAAGTAVGTVAAAAPHSETVAVAASSGTGPRAAAAPAAAPTEGYAIAHGNAVASPADGQAAPLKAQATGGGDEFMFLCPQGHQLHGPTSLVGKAGQCPHCSTRFIVPSPEDIPDDDAHNDQIHIHIDTTPKLPSSSLSVLNPGKSLPAQAERHPMAVLFADLWAQRTEGVSVELHFGDGKVLIPEQYSPQKSHPDHGLFAVREANGSRTLTAVAWDSVARVAVRGLAQLPKDFFDARG